MSKPYYPQLFHYGDPAAKNAIPWHYCYLHGQAEEYAGSIQQENGWDWQAPDLICSDQPMPTEPGQYECSLYGKPIMVFIDKHRFVSGLAGRAAFESDKEAYLHAQSPEQWR